MHTNYYFFIPLLALLLSANSIFSENENFDPQTITIENVYATTTKVPQYENHILNCFDGDTTTVWQTMDGIHMNEGIMIYFPHPTYIYDVVLYDENGKVTSEYDKYCNGRPVYYGTIDHYISSLFIKFRGSNQFKNGEYSVGISEIELLDENENAYAIKAPKLIKGQVKASSALTPEIAYSSNNLVDGQKESAWSEAVKGLGVGQKINFTLEEETQINKLKIWNGYQRSNVHFLANASMKSFTFGVKGGEKKSYTINREQGGQVIDLGITLTGKEFELEITGADAGTKYEDLVISEILLKNGNSSISIFTGEEEKRVKNNIALNHKVLKKVLDKRLNDEKKEAIDESVTVFQTSSISLRSNNTFVFYNREEEEITEKTEDDDDFYEEDDSSVISEVIADGNWEIKSITDDKIIIRIFGKKFTPLTSQDIYKGKTEGSAARIFQDNVTITNDVIKGQKVLAPIRIF
ncbi:NADase-type glycan-binding domain-containing protein [Flammeovirga aprica]|uniref:NAD glycohydrolase translocation F5/8 type C domain-containing protein n=1 Tax=Flammeovirga aprica JL-4 TaxID=694437 RepID=A0A7X9RZ72_9BACT|nr:hypothetical protein [Flammeovirga aprica]NME71408.1 hypothetical protein [Flammeovirga aprica JL-4]